MNISIQPGKYVVAVSGGVDSMALLHMLQGLPGLELVVAHFDHGIRPDSIEDRLLVQRAAEDYGLSFEYGEGRLGKSASEAVARQARYGFLHDVLVKSGAQTIITAHHQDDVLETALINIIRGTGRKGLASLQSTDVIIRPLLDMPKADLITYARSHKLVWHEDSTNTDRTYLRNHIRHEVMPRLTAEQKAKLLDNIGVAAKLNQAIDTELDDYLKSQKIHGQLDRPSFILLPHKVALEVMAVWLRGQGIRSFDKKMLERCVRGAKILRAGTRISLNDRAFLSIGREFLALGGPER
jgi:tRNA(Ile)-lysidine synthase